MQKRHLIFRSLLIIATPYLVFFLPSLSLSLSLSLHCSLTAGVTPAGATSINKDYIQQNRPIFLRSLLIIATVYHLNTLQNTAAYCNTLQHTATMCNTRQHTSTPAYHHSNSIALTVVATPQGCSRTFEQHSNISNLVRATQQHSESNTAI